MTDHRDEALASERDFLLTSLDDLDTEFAAGDIDQHDYDELKDSYTARTAVVLRSLAERDAATKPVEHVRSPRWPWVLGLSIVGVLAGWALAQAAGERGTGGLTGAVTESLRDRVLVCQQMGTDMTRLVESLECFDGILDEDPNNVEALTYRGWYVILASRTAGQAGDLASAAELLASGITSLDRAIEIAPSAPDARAFRTVAREQLGDIDGACEDVAALDAGDPSPMIAGLVAPVAERLGCG